MKKIVLIILVISSLKAYSQGSKKDSLLREIDEHVKTVQKAADKFLNRQLSTAERLKAIQPYALIYDESQVEQFKKVILDDKEPPEIRAVAVNKIYSFVPGDEKLEALTTEWLGNSHVPKVLRQEALRLDASLSFLSMDVPDVYQKMLEDPEPEFRLYAFTKLIVHGDARAQQKLIEGLENHQSALLSAPDAIQILSMSPKKEYYPAVFKILQQTKDEATRLQAISSLGFYKEAREKLANISRDTNEKEQFREASLAALFIGDKDNIVNYATPILSDKSATPQLQIIALKMTIYASQSAAYSGKAEQANEFNRLIKGISEDKTKDPELKKVALEYIQSARQ